MKDLDQKKLEELIADAMFGQPLPGNSITLHTGRGGVKEFIKSWCEEIGVEYNRSNFMKQYRAMRKAGWIKMYKY